MKALFTAAAALAVGPPGASAGSLAPAPRAIAGDCTRYPITLPPLKFTSDHLEPFISTEIMVLHHSKHFQAYINNANLALGQLPQPTDCLETLITQLDTLPEGISKTLRNHGGGFLNHKLYFHQMGFPSDADPNDYKLVPSTVENPPSKELEVYQQLERDFGSYSAFRNAFTANATSVFGSGWTWLALQVPPAASAAGAGAGAASEGREKGKEGPSS